MALELRQQLKLSQQLVMTPQLQQAIKLLQLSRLELVESIQQELMDNPLLEEVLEEEKGDRQIADDDHAPKVGGEDTAIEKELIKNAEWDDYLGDFASTPVQSHIRETEIPEDGMAFDARLSSKPSLEGHLDWQMRLSNFTPKELAIGEAICGSLDSSGYLSATAGELAHMTGATPEEVEAALYKVQRLDPVGVAARNPRECLLVQMEVLGLTEDPILVELVSEHLEDLEGRRYKPLVKKLKITMEQLKIYLDTIQTLDPLPGASFGSSDPIYVSPDAFIYKYGDDFIILLNEEGLPRLQLSSMYLEDFIPKGDKERDYIQDKKRSAEWLMKSLYQRQRTLYKVLESIVRFQRGFFEEGVTRLRPLILKDVADDISMHESTVSRITSNKYAATPHGIFELKFFFNSSLELDDGSTVGSESVKATIRQLIASEDPRKPISDEAIADILKERLQINIARRTVAKYRTAMNIASSSKRKEMF